MNRKWKLRVKISGVLHTKLTSLSQQYIMIFPCTMSNICIQTSFLMNHEIEIAQYLFFRKFWVMLLVCWGTSLESMRDCCTAGSNPLTAANLQSLGEERIHMQKPLNNTFKYWCKSTPVIEWGGIGVLAWAGKMFHFTGLVDLSHFCVSCILHVLILRMNYWSSFYINHSPRYGLSKLKPFQNARINGLWPPVMSQPSFLRLQQCAS